MANFEITPLGTHMELNWRGLYLYHTPSGPNINQSTVIGNDSDTGIGCTAVNNWTIHDGPGPDAMIVARAQGLHIHAGGAHWHSNSWHNTCSLVFENERFKGSTLEVMGISFAEGEWAIVGGTGQFAMATGVIYKNIHERTRHGNIMEVILQGFCPLLKGSKNLLTKIGPWGGNGGAAQDIIETPKRLESIIVRSGTVIDSIAFSYIDQAGQRRTAGPWGGPGGNPHTIQLGSSEFVKEVSGTFGMFEGVNVINSIKIVTNVKSHGPFGRENGTPFNDPVQNNSSVVGFFGHSGKYLDALGIYLQQLSLSPMANPCNFQITPLGTHMELNWRGLYLYHTPGGSKPNQSMLIDNDSDTGLGRMTVNNWTVHDGPGPDAMVVARAQGLHIHVGSSNWHNTFSLVFENERFKGSTLVVMGMNVSVGEWAIVGGTGQFAMATGVIYKNFHEQRSDGNIMELILHGFCPLLKGSKVIGNLLTKIGPWGGKGGAAQDIIEAPKRLESITVRSGTVIDSIAFSYIDQAGQRHTAGPWGGPGGNPHTIQLGTSEVVNEVYGTFGKYKGEANVINSIKIVTNVKSHGPFGRENGTPFNVPVQNNSTIVGFFGRGGKYLDAIGIYVQQF